MKSLLHLAMDSEIIQRAKLNNINISKECEEHLRNILSMKTYSTPTEKEEIVNEVKEKELKLIEITKELNALKDKQLEIDQEDKQQKERLSKIRIVKL